MSIFRKLFGQKESDGENPDFTALVEGSMEGLRLQTEGHQNTWRFGEEDHWDFSQDTGELIFTFPDMIASAPAQIIGSFDSNAGTWMWSWANASIVKSLTGNAMRVRKYGEQQRIRRLTTPSWSGEERDGWHMAALANRLCATNGVYRGPAGDTFVFFTFGEIHLRKGT